jgi:hypothetical protein
MAGTAHIPDRSLLSASGDITWPLITEPQQFLLRFLFGIEAEVVSQEGRSFVRLHCWIDLSPEESEEAIACAWDFQRSNRTDAINLFFHGTPLPDFAVQ